MGNELTGSTNPELALSSNTTRSTFEAMVIGFAPSVRRWR